jgi:hypothetical protein
MSFPRGPVKPTVSPRGLTTGSIKTIKNTKIISIFNWIPWSSHGMTTSSIKVMLALEFQKTFCNLLQYLQ